MSERRFSTEQEDFWAGSFGSEYIDRNRSARLVSAATHRFSRILQATTQIRSVIEFGANIGINLHALHALLPEAKLAGLEINSDAFAELKSLPWVTAYHGSMLDFAPPDQYDLTFTSGVLIHIAPEALPAAYARLYESSSRYIALVEYYNPTPVEITYRGHARKAFKRDFAGEMLERFSDLELRSYGFFYRRDANFPSDDVNWFLLERRPRS